MKCLTLSSDRWTHHSGCTVTRHEKPNQRGHDYGQRHSQRYVKYKQRWNILCSTGSDLVGGLNDVMPQILWTRYFLQAQGYVIKDSIIDQDNQTSILAETHGRASSSKGTQHFNIWYFFVTNQITSQDVSVNYCHTGEMIPHFFRKTLKGTPFQKFRNFIINVDPFTNSPRKIIGGACKIIVGVF